MLMCNLCDKVIKYSLYLLAFLVPVFFLPFSAEAYEFNKQYLLFFLISIAFIFWLVKMVVCDKEIKLRRTPLDILILIFLLAAALSAAFSIDRVHSILGFYGRFWPNLLGLFSLGGLYFLITNNVGANKKISAADKAKSALINTNGLINALLWSSFFAVLIGYFSIFGIWQKLGNAGINLPFDILRNTFNPVSGFLEGLAVFLAVIIVLLVGLLVQTSKSKPQIFSQGGLLLACLGLLLIIDFKAAWMVLLFSLAVFLALAFCSRIFRERINVLLLPIFLAVFSLIFIFINLNTFVPGSIADLRLPQEILLNQADSWKAGLRAAGEYPVLGSGPATFSHIFSLFRPIELNQTGFWQIRVDRAGSHIAEALGTTGLVGFISYLMLIAGFLLVLLRFIQRNVSKSQSAILNQFPLFTTFLCLFAAQFFYYQNTCLAFMFWLFLGCAVAGLADLGGFRQAKQKQKTILRRLKAGIIRISYPSFRTQVVSLKNFPEISLLFNVFLIMLVAGAAGAYYFMARFYYADALYKQGVVQNKIEKVEKARNLNPYRAVYRDELAKLYLSEALAEAGKPADSRDINKIKDKTTKAISEARAAESISPHWVRTHETLAIIYRDMKGIVQGAEQWAIKSFQSAIVLEPFNPVLHTELGKVLFLSGEAEQARKEFEKALEMKPDYLDAKIQLALSYEDEDISKTIKMLEEAVASDLYSAEAHFELGRVYFNEHRIDEAIDQFQSALALKPLHSNALYSLGIAYQQQGMNKEAVSMFEKVLELNPGNEDVAGRLEELRKETASQGQEAPSETEAESESETETEAESEIAPEPEE